MLSTGSTVQSPPSGRLFVVTPRQVYKEKKQHSKPPVSLLGQLLWREFYYVVAAHTPNYHRMEGNAICKQIPWDDNEEFFRAWEDSRTGYPWIDAIMAQLRRTGWMHHLARHCVVRIPSLHYPPVNEKVLVTASLTLMQPHIIASLCQPCPHLCTLVCAQTMRGVLCRGALPLPLCRVWSAEIGQGLLYHLSCYCATAASSTSAGSDTDKKTEEVSLSCAACFFCKYTET